jgi:hypothetical protein
LGEEERRARERRLGVGVEWVLRSRLSGFQVFPGSKKP